MGGFKNREPENGQKMPNFMRKWGFTKLIVQHRVGQINPLYNMTIQKKPLDLCQNLD